MANTLPIFPTSPVPASMRFSDAWNESNYAYDSGAHQGVVARTKPFRNYEIDLENIPISKQSSLRAFFNDRRATAFPWLFQDPYENQVAGQVAINTANTRPTSFYIFDAQSFWVVPKSGSILITSNLSGALTQGSHYILDQDTGILVASLQPASADFWTASCSYFKKVHFTQSFDQTSRLWQMFSGSIAFEEIV
jgi:hypothetical protein